MYVCMLCMPPEGFIEKHVSFFLASCTHLTLGDSPQECETAVEHFVCGPMGILGCVCFVPYFMLSRFLVTSFWK